MLINTIWFFLVVLRFTFYMLPVYLFSNWPTRWKHEVFWPETIRRHRARFKRDLSAEFWAAWKHDYDKASKEALVSLLAVTEMMARTKSGISPVRSEVSPPQETG
jgi:hypothetical protein